MKKAKKKKPMTAAEKVMSKYGSKSKRRYIYHSKPGGTSTRWGKIQVKDT